jgi:hypothetical protein
MPRGCQQWLGATPHVHESCHVVLAVRGQENWKQGAPLERLELQRKLPELL